MSKTTGLRLREIRALYQLVGECRELGHDRIAWREHFIAGLNRLTDAEVGFVGEMANCHVLRPMNMGVVYRRAAGPGAPTPIKAARVILRTEPQSSEIMNAYFRAKLRSDGIALTRKDLLPDDRPWYASTEFRLARRAYRTDHVMLCFRDIPGATPGESCGVSLLRAEGRLDFQARDRRFTQEVLAALAPLVGGPLARFRDPSPSDLPPRARDVLECLLKGGGDKQIGSRLGITPHTVNQYTKQIYRHFHVKGRVELLALWLRRTRLRTDAPGTSIG